MIKESPFADRLRFGSKLGLDRITVLCERLGDPQLRFKTIHIAGTNGKGSTAVMMANILQYSGYRVGLFTSPHLVYYNERFQVNGTVIEDEMLYRTAEIVNSAIVDVEKHYPQYGPFTEFEAAAMLAFCYFARQQIDYGVIEVGLGGRLDATNVVMPELSVITPIGHDHMERLGSTLENIAAEKAGIIKPLIPVVSSKQFPVVDEILSRTAAHNQSEYYRLQDVIWQPLETDLKGGTLLYPYFSQTPFAIKLVGKHQLENAALALMAIQVLHEKGLQVKLNGIEQGLKTAGWPGRFQVISTKPFRVLDSAHNREGIESLAKALQEFFANIELTLVLGISANKPLRIIDPLLPVGKRLIFTEALNSRVGACSAQKLHNYAYSKGFSSEVILDHRQLLKTVASDNVCFCGSIYLIAEIEVTCFGK